MQALALQQGCRHALIAESMLLLPLQEVYTSKDVKKLLVQLQSDLMVVVDKVGTGLPQRRALCQTDCMHCLLKHASVSHTTGMLHLLLCQIPSGACT